MTGRVIVTCALLSGAVLSCMNTSQPRSRQAVLDRTAPPPAAGALVADAPAPRAADLAEVEVLPVAGSSLGRMRATVMVRAAVDRVRAVIFDFPNYPSFVPHYKSARVVAKTPEGGTQVHMEIDALGGMIRRWMRIEVSPPTVVGTRESYEARLIEGDVKAFETRWVLDKLVDGTRLTLESFLDAKLTLPSAFIDAGSAAGVKESILAIKARAEDGAP